jgi:protein SCO1/2
VVAGWLVVWVTGAGHRLDLASAGLPGVEVGGHFSLIDQHGRAVTEETYSGRWMLVYFGYTSCPDVCPTELQNISAALDRLGPDAVRIVPLFVTVDPERDTPGVLADYTKLFDDRLIGLTGRPEQIAAMAKAYRVYYAKAPTKKEVTANDAGRYQMDHSSFVYLMGPDGKFRGLFRPGTSPQELAEAIRDRMATTT